MATNQGLSAIPGEKPTIQQRREQITALNAFHEPKPEDVVEEDLRIPSRGKHSIPVRVYKGRLRRLGGEPLYIMIHGGGFSMGDLDMKEEDCRRLVVKFGFVALNIDYRLAPEYPWPAAVEDCWDALKWVC